ncbi:MAG: hypothetical protein IT366_10935 [Candidatus Hydrogenedentes bacterium]|nr:hypothetical protein [Candidatus Hydrogenedentota bacterium]
MDMDEVRIKIRDLRIMRGLDDPLVEKLTDLLQSISAPRVVPAGGVFIHEREHVDNKGYILLQGAVLVRKTGFPDITCKAPELIGEIMQFNPAGVRTATCAGAVESIVLRFMWDEFWQKAEQILSADELAKLKEKLETQAWEHFLR